MELRQPWLSTVAHNGHSRTQKALSNGKVKAIAVVIYLLKVTEYWYMEDPGCATIKNRSLFKRQDITQTRLCNILQYFMAVKQNFQ